MTAIPQLCEALCRGRFLPSHIMRGVGAIYLLSIMRGVGAKIMRICLLPSVSCQCGRYLPITAQLYGAIYLPMRTLGSICRYMAWHLFIPILYLFVVNTHRFLQLRF